MIWNFATPHHIFALHGFAFATDNARCKKKGMESLAVRIREQSIGDLRNGRCLVSDHLRKSSYLVIRSLQTASQNKRTWVLNCPRRLWYSSEKSNSTFSCPSAAISPNWNCDVCSPLPSSAHHLRNRLDELLCDSVVPCVVPLRLGVGRRVRQSLLKKGTCTPDPYNLRLRIWYKSFVVISWCFLRHIIEWVCQLRKGRFLFIPNPTTQWLQSR